MDSPRPIVASLLACAVSLLSSGCTAAETRPPGHDAGQDAGAADLGADARSEPDGAADLDASTDGGTPDGGPRVLCIGGGATVFPTFARACTIAGDCAVVEHQIDCCGTFRALGIRADEQTAFDAAEAECRVMYPGCGCASRPTEADDGTVDDGVTAARVDCLAGECTSTFTLGNGDICAAGGTACGPGLACCYPCGIPGCEFRCEPACDPGTPGCVSGCLPRP